MIEAVRGGRGGARGEWMGEGGGIGGRRVGGWVVEVGVGVGGEAAKEATMQSVCCGSGEDVR